MTARIPTRPRPPTLAAVCAGLALLAVVAAGCGASSKAASSTTTATHSLAAIKYARCMRSHGVNVLDPDQNGNIQIAAPDTPKAVVNRAQQACQKLRTAALGVGLNAKQHARALAQFTKFTHCMRAHQIPMADPITGPRGAVGYYVPQGISPTSRLYVNAEKACKNLLPNG